MLKQVFETGSEHNQRTPVIHHLGVLASQRPAIPVWPITNLINRNRGLLPWAWTQPP